MIYIRAHKLKNYKCGVTKYVIKKKLKYMWYQNMQTVVVTTRQ